LGFNDIYSNTRLGLKNYSSIYKVNVSEIVKKKYYVFENVILCVKVAGHF